MHFLVAPSQVELPFNFPWSLGYPIRCSKPNKLPGILGCHLAFLAHPLGFLLCSVYLWSMYIIIYVIFYPKSIHNGYINGIYREEPVLYTHSNGMGVFLLHRLDIEMVRK